jgi:diketogulonate reductase-like aldo/keto reductase
VVQSDNATEPYAEVGYIDLLLMHQPCDYLAPYPYNASAETAGAWPLRAQPDILKCTRIGTRIYQITISTVQSVWSNLLGMVCCAAIYGAMEDAFLNEMKGKIKALGVSNFDAHMLARLAETSRAPLAGARSRC